MHMLLLIRWLKYNIYKTIHAFFSFINGETEQFYLTYVAFILFALGSLTLGDLELVVGVLLMNSDEGFLATVVF